MIGENVRDKDAVASCAIISELVAFSKDQGQTLFDRLISIYQEYGYFKESLISITKPGKTGAEEIQEIMLKLRKTPPVTFGGSKIARVLDYQSSEAQDLITGDTSTINLPTSNVLQFITEDGSKISARPSGTEPKIKFYISVRGKLEVKELFDAATADLDTKIEEIKQDLQEFTS
jgi:phosphoglucomutase